LSMLQIFSVRLSEAINSSVGGSSSQSTPSAEYLMILTSLALLAPAKYAFSAGRPWHTALFVAMATICTAYHICDAQAPSSLLSGVHCPQPLPHILTLADHGCAYFCFLQMALLLLGPEDHNMQWPVDPANPRKPWARVPTSVMLYSRALPLIGVLSFLAFYPDWREFHYQMIFLCIVLVLHGAGQFWLSYKRREHAPQVLFHAVFWRRLVTLGLFPICLCLVLFISMEKFESGLAHATWHVWVAVLAMNVQRTIYHSLVDPLHMVLSLIARQNAPAADVHSTPPKNPIIAHYFLASIAVTMSVTFMAGRLVGAMVPHSHYDWPVLGLDSLQWQTGYMLAIGSLSVILAIASTFGLIATVHIPWAKSDGQFHWRRVGCALGFSSSLFGLLAIVASADGMPSKLRALVLAATACSAAAGVALTTFSEFSTSSMLIRRMMAAATCVTAAVFVTSLYTLHQYGALQHVALSHNGGTYYHVVFPRAWRCLALSQYCLAGLLAAWPLTYVAQVRERWTTTTPLNGKLAKWPLAFAGIEF